MRENPNHIFQSLRNAPIELKHCTRHSSSILRPEAKRTWAWWQDLQVHKNAVQRLKFTLLSYTLRKGLHSDALNKWRWKATIAEVKRTRIKLPHSQTQVCILGLQKRALGKSKFRLKHSAISSWHVYPDFCLLYNSARIKNPKPFSSRWPKSCKVRGRAMRTETHLFGARKSRDSRQMCIPIPTSMGECYCFKVMPDWIIRDLLQCFSQCVLKEISQRLLFCIQFSSELWLQDENLMRAWPPELKSSLLVVNIPFFSSWNIFPLEEKKKRQQTQRAKKAP